jgi:hypothetical protein
VIVTVDWEGEELTRQNLEMFARIRRNFAEVPLVQYLNAAYFTKPAVDQTAVKKEIDAVLRTDDQLGLHIHGWKSLFTQAGVTFRTEPSWEPNLDYSTMKNCDYDCGHEIPITAYTEDELRKVIQTSRQILAAQGYENLRQFRAGGWMSSEALLTALAKEGFQSDSSAVPSPFLAGELADSPLLRWVKRLWPSTTPLSQPYIIKKVENAALTEFPDNGALADYMKASEMLSVVKANLNELKSGETRYVVVGFHTETVFDYYSEITAFLKEMRAIMARNPDRVVYGVFP